MRTAEGIDPGATGSVGRALRETAAVAMIEVTDLRKRHAPQAPEAVAGLSFQVERGEVFGRVRPNGAGKTRTIGTMTTRVRPTSGSVRIDGVPVHLRAGAAVDRLGGAAPREAAAARRADPAGGLHVADASWAGFALLLVAGGLAGAAIGLVLGCSVPAQRISVVFSIVLTPR